MDQAGGGHTYTYKQYGARWRMLAIIFFANVVVQVIFITFAPIATPASLFYKVDPTAINWLALVWPALFIPSTAVSAWSFHKYGLRHTMAVSGAVLAVGAAVRLMSMAVPVVKDDLGNSSKPGIAYGLVLVGTMIVASIQPMVLSSTTQLASAWFSENQRALANTLMSLGNPTGLAIGALISPALSREQDGHGIDKIILLQFALSLLCAFSCLFLSSSPPTAPSSTAAYRRGNDNLGRDLKSLRNNFGFMTLCNLFSLSVGAFQALLTLLEQILRPAGYNTTDAGNFSAVLILCGIVGAGIMGPLVDATRRYKLILAMCLTLSFPFTVAIAYNSQRANRKPALYVCSAFMGFFGFPVLSVALDLSAEITYPIPAGLTSALLWCGSQVTTLILVILVDGPLAEELDGGPDSLEVGVWLLVGCFAASVFLSWLWSGRYVRKEAEETVSRLRQAQRRDTGLPFVAGVIDSPATNPSERHLSGDSRNVSPTHMQSVPHSNSAAIAAYVAASQSVASAPPASAGDREMTRLELQ